MSLTDDGYFQASLDAKMQAICTLIKKYIPQIDLVEGEWMYQLAKILAMREMDIQDQAQNLIDSLSIATATGNALYQLCANLGVYIKAGNYANGTVLAKENVILAGDVINIGEEINQNGFYYKATEQAALSPIIQIRRGSSDTDLVPYPYVVEDVGWIGKFQSSASEVYDPSYYSLVSNTIVWDTGSAIPSYASFYYLAPKTNVEVTIPIIAEKYNSDSNCVAGTIFSDDNLPNVTFVAYTDITGGTGRETDAALRARALNARYRNRTVGSLKALIENVPGVRQASIQEVEGVDVSMPPTWSENVPESYSGSEMVRPSVITEPFMPGDGIASIRSIDLRLAKPAVDATGVMVVTLKSSGGISLTKGYVTEYNFDYMLSTQTQTINVPLLYAPINSNETYYIEVSFTGTYLNKLPYEIEIYDGPGNMTSTPTVTTGTDICMHTNWLSNAYNVLVLPEDGISFSTVQPLVQSILDSETGGFGTFGVEAIVDEITSDEMEFDLLLYLAPGYLSSDISTPLADALSAYLNSLGIGEKIVWLSIITTIMNIPGVYNISGIEIKKNGNAVASSIAPSDVMIEKSHKAVPATPVAVITYVNI